MGTAKTITFEGTKDEVVAEVLAWVGVEDVWSDYSLDEKIDPLELFDAPGCDYIVESLDSELPGQSDQWMTFVVTNEDQATNAILRTIDELVSHKPKRPSYLKLVKG